MSDLGKNDKWIIYQDARNEWRWRRTAPNGKIVGASNEGYTSHSNCKSNARRNGWVPIAEKNKGL